MSWQNMSDTQRPGSDDLKMATCVKILRAEIISFSEGYARTNRALTQLNVLAPFVGRAMIGPRLGEQCGL